MSSPIPSQNTPTTTPPAASNPGTPILEPSATPHPERIESEAAMEVDDEAPMGLPLSKIKRIFKMDSEYMGASQSAVYATGVATELFVQYLTEQASLLAKMDKRKKILYKDLSTAVSSQDSLSFLSDTIPKTIPLREVIQVEAPKPVEAEIAPPVERKVDITTMFPRQEENPPKKANINSLVDNDDVVMVE